MRSVVHQHRAPGESAADPFEQQRLAALDAAAAHAGVERQRDRGGRGAAALTDGAKAGKESVVVINADANAKHQAVISVMEAARRAGMNQITFATQSSAQAGAK